MSDGIRLNGDLLCRWPAALRDCRLLAAVGSQGTESLMRYKPKSSAALHIALGGLPAQMPVKVDADIEVSATVWPENLAVTTPQDRYPDSAVRVSKVSVAARTSPKS